MTSSISPQEIHIDGMQVIYDRSLLPQFSAELFKPQTHVGVAEVYGQAMGRGDALFFNHAGHNLVLRHFRRGGFVRHFIADRYPGVRASASRSFREWQLLAVMYRQGLPVPRPVAASFCPAGLFYRADLVTRQVEDVRPLSSIIQEQLPAELWINLGATLRRFHNAQIYHADLNAHNILLDQQLQATLIDFDRGAIRTGQGWKQENLARLLRSLKKITVDSTASGLISDGWQQLLSGYVQSSR